MADLKTATETLFTDGEKVWGSDSAETGPKVFTDMVGKAATQTLTNKTLTLPVISQIKNTGTLTLPTSTDTLIGRATTDTLTNKTLTAPAVSAPAFTGLGNWSVTTGITAASPGVQGDVPLTSWINVVATVGTANDAVTMPTAAAGLACFILNRGVSTLEVWPASGDNFQGSSVDTAITITAATNKFYISIDGQTWETLV